MSLYGRFPVWQVSTQLLHFKIITTFFYLNPILLHWTADLWLDVQHLFCFLNIEPTTLRFAGVSVTTLSLPRCQCDQIGHFLKGLDVKFSYKSSPNIIEKSIVDKNCWSYFLGKFWKHLGYFLFLLLVTLHTARPTSCWSRRTSHLGILFREK